jgi:hypothetical protein
MHILRDFMHSLEKLYGVMFVTVTSDRNILQHSVVSLSEEEAHYKYIISECSMHQERAESYPAK